MTESAGVSRGEKGSAYVTKDGSTIRELMHPDHTIAKQQSLAEATVAPGEITEAHYHQVTEEFYFILEGQGIMMLGDEHFAVGPGDTVCIRPGIRHHIRNDGDINLKFLCCCSPAYSHDDTYLL